MIVTVSHVNTATALELVSSAFEFAATKEWKIAVCVVDAAGATVASARMDGVSSQTLTFAEDKAFTAATMRRSTAAFFDRMDQSPSLRLGIANRDRLLVWGGGVPVKFEGSIVGGIGVSGAQDFEDVACAQEALRCVGLAWE
ncbi:heme-binding protein [Rhizobium sp. RHZ01]|uniref:GlcG/HbpS family heme-binding protein n=1 Tax=Rhizobium sp. RHZ01 TaxID=2769304 RepID=UPI001784AF72|nr:heme-binding protein [Rhizobium sp. RHZ01]MBD9448503.1 heme-binding protein [Rhizobium sp. RHZ01]